MNIQCILCPTTFLFSVGQQEDYVKKGFENIPKRWAKCRGQDWYLIYSRPQEAALMELTASLCTLRLMITPILILLIKLTSPYVKEPNIHADSLKQDAVEEETTACSIMMIKAGDEHSIRLPIRDPSFLLLG